MQSRFGSTLPLLCQNNPPNCKKKLPEPPSILQLFQCQGYEKIIFTHPPAPEPRGFLICLTIFTTVLFCRGKGTGLLLQCLSYPLDFLCFSLSRALRVMLHLKKKKKKKPAVLLLRQPHQTDSHWYSTPRNQLSKPWELMPWCFGFGVFFLQGGG